MDIIEELMVALISTFKSYLDIVIVIYICLFIIVIAIEVIFLIKNKSDIYFIKQVFLFLYNYENNQLKKEYEINFLEKVAKEFNLNNLVLLEKIKKDNNFFFSLISSNFLSNQLNETNQDNSHIKLNDKPIMNKETKTKIKEKQDENINNNYKKIKNNLEQNSMNGSLLNNSINNNSSMVQLINKNNNKDIINDLKNQQIELKKAKKVKV